MNQIQLDNGSATHGGVALGGIGDAAKFVQIDPATGLPVPIGPGGIGGGVEDLLFTDDAGTQFIYRDNGATPPVFTAYRIPAGTAYTVGANPRPYYVRDVASSIADGASVALGAKADGTAAWYSTAASLISKIGLLIAATVGAGSHVYGYDGSGNMTTDAWTLFGTTRTKTYTYTSGNLTAESDWV